MYSAEVICDSVSPAGARLTTMCLTYPRIVHSELMTHRMLSRNSASSRAIPWAVMSEQISSNPFVPLSYGLEQRGMQQGDTIPEVLLPLANAIWLAARDSALDYANMLHNIGQTAINLDFDSVILSYLADSEYDAIYDWDDDTLRIHKSIPNRITEPWMWITVVVSATHWQNLFRLRCHHAAEQHIRKVIELARAAYNASVPVQRVEHLPYVLESESGLDSRFAISTARCARVSYNRQGGSDVAADLALHDRLLADKDAPHVSPFEHPATAAEGRHGNFVGWRQYRQTIPNESGEG